MFTRLSKYIGQYKKDTLLTIFFTVGEVAFEVIIPLLIAMLIDEGISKGNMSRIFVIAGYMLVATAIALIFGILSGRFAAKASTGYATNLRTALFKHIQSFSFSNIDKFQGAGLITRITTDVGNIQRTYQLLIRLFMRAPAMIIFSIIMTVIISRDLSLIYVAGVIFLTIVFSILIKISLKYFNEVFAKYDELNASIQENVRGIRVVKSFVREDYEISRFDKAMFKLYQMFLKAENSVVIIEPVLLFTMYMATIALSFFGARKVSSGILTTGELASLYNYIIGVFVSIMILAFVFVMTVISEASAKRIIEVFDEQSDILNKENPIKEVKDGSISFENVCFSYKKDSLVYVLSDVNLEINSGETIGIIGGTGSSKTSLVNLISRLYDVNKGSVKVAGIDVRDYDLETLRKNIAVVLQKNELISGTILDNLRIANKNASLDECKKACEIANASEFIEKLQDGYNSHVEQGGANFSGGQKQRLCIARAILANPKIIIFDDSTSAVDTATENKIRTALRTSLSSTTKLIIAQRISSIKDADRIIVMNEGRVDAFDTHENLLVNNEIYKSIAKVQLESAGDFDAKEEV